MAAVLLPYGDKIFMWLSSISVELEFHLKGTRSKKFCIFFAQAMLLQEKIF